ncbi:MAG: bifunctional glutamate N-acetyltransferase/amino-acid acetyltransferase ArgJ [Solirubrobacterales bacterium]|nr:bifunctional glutamate N-acetyltransferase/amino-acid acetyltransferase ArgJ [Solirubrobacterales bacterium]
MSTPEKLECPSLFDSRWVDLPDGIETLDPNILPKGFRAGGVAAGIKPSGKVDFGIVVSDSEETTSAARFTISSAPAAPVQVCRTRVDLDQMRAVVVNSGNANAATGPFGRDNAFYMQGAGAMACGAPENKVGVASTGVIGQQLNTRDLTKGAQLVSRELKADNALSFAEAICTTDLWIKAATLKLDLSGGAVILSGQAKGAGMIAPLHAPHATLLAFIETDARITSAQADAMLGTAVTQSFDRVTVDAQLSTNDSVFLMAGGQSGVGVAPGSDDEAKLVEALNALLKGLAISLVRDGEGAGRIGKITVTGGDPALCEKTARAIADSPLVKTALNGGDPNWGRIMQAAGMALSTGKPEGIDIVIEGVEVATFGIKNDFDMAALEEAVSVREVEYAVRIPGEGHEATLYFSDLGHAYVTLNAEYTT